MNYLELIIKVFKSKNIILFLGPDGSGKTTISKDVCKNNTYGMYRVYMNARSLEDTHRPFNRLLAKFDLYRNKFNKNTFRGVVIRICYYVICYFDLYYKILQIKKEFLFNGWVCADRYSYDYFLRTLDANNDVLRKFLYYTVFPRPQYVFLFVGSNKIISERKKELTEKDVARTIKRYRDFLKSKKIRFSEINTTENNKEECKKIILKHIGLLSL